MSPFSVFVSLVPRSVGLQVFQDERGPQRAVVLWARIEADGSEDAERLAEWEWEVWIHARGAEAGPVGEVQYRPFTPVRGLGAVPEGGLVTTRMHTEAFQVLQSAALAGQVPTSLQLRLEGVAGFGEDGERWKLTKPEPLGSVELRWGVVEPE